MDSVTAAVYRELLLAYLAGPKNPDESIAMVVGILAQEAKKMSQTSS